MAIITEIIPTFSQKTIFGYKAIAFSSVAIALLGFLVWGHHMFVAGMSLFAGAIFCFLTFFVAIPSAIKVFNWIATMYRGSITLGSADALRPLLPAALHHRRADRPLPGRAVHRRPPARHLLRRGALPLRDDGLEP